MVNLTVTIKKSEILDEVAKTTAYMGAKSKMIDGKSAYDQVFVTDADLVMIERFYNESKDALTNLFKRFISSITEDTWTLGMSDMFDSNVSGSINSSVSSFMVNSIVSKWCEITDKENVGEYAGNAATVLADIKDKLFAKKKPTRTTIKK